MNKYRKWLQAKRKKKAAAYIRVRRRDRALWKWGEKLYVPCTLKTKGRYMEAAREAGMSQAEFGLVVVEAAIRDEKWLRKAIKRHRRMEAIEHDKEVEAGRGT